MCECVGPVHSPGRHASVAAADEAGAVPHGSSGLTSLPQFCDKPQPLYMLVRALQYLCLPSAQGDFDTRAGRECKLDYVRAVRQAQEGVIKSTC